MIVPSLILFDPFFNMALSFLLQKYFPKEATTSSPKSAISSKAERVSFSGVVDGFGCDCETGISTLIGEMSKGEVGKIDIREVEEVGIGVLICEEGIVERGGNSTWEDGICEDVVVV